MILELSIILLSFAARHLSRPVPPLPPPVVQTAPQKPLSISIPIIELTSSITPVGLTEEKIVDTPASDVGWYSQGPIPGEIGNATLNGHTPGIFNKINQLQIGDDIYIYSTSSQKQHFKVIAKDYVETEKFPLEKVYGSTPNKMLNLITCAGTNHRNIIYSQLVDSFSTQ